MPAVERLLQLFDLDERDGVITAFDSFGGDVHLGTSTGKLIRLSVSESASPPRSGEARKSPHSAPSLQSKTNAATGATAGDQRSLRDAVFTSPSTDPTTTVISPTTATAQREGERAEGADEAFLRTAVARQCTLSTSGSPVQQLQHSRSQRVIFVLCEGRLQLLHAETYAVLTSIASNVVSFSLASPVCSSTSSSGHSSKRGLGTLGEESGAPTPALTFHYGGPSRLPSGWPGSEVESEVFSAVLPSRNISHTRTSSEGSYGSGQPWTPRSSTATAGIAYPGSPGSPAMSGPPPRKPSKVHVVCVAERNKKELAVYVVDRVTTRARGSHSAAAAAGASATTTTASAAAATAVGASRSPAALSPSTAELNSGSGNGSEVSHHRPSSASPPARVVLRQRYVLPEPVQRVVMCTPAPLHVAQHGAASASSSATPAAAAVPSGATPTAVEAGLTVCVGMRREVSLLPLLGGVPRCVLRLDGSRPPLLSIGSDYNTYVVRTQAPNTVMEVGVPPSAAAAGLRTGASREEQAAALLNPIALRIGYQHQKRPFASSSSPLVQPGKEDELIMGDVFQSDAAVELVLARFPFVFLFTASYCDVVSLLNESSSSTGTHRSPNAGGVSDHGVGTSSVALSSSALPASLSTVQRIPLAGVRHGALRGHGTSVFVASDRTVWSLQLYPLRAQLADMVHAGRTEEAFQLLAFHQQRALASARDTAATIYGESRSQQHTFALSSTPPQPLASLERDLHRMAGFTSLCRGEVVAALRTLRGYLDPRELLLSLPDCIPTHATTTAAIISSAVSSAAAPASFGGHGAATSCPESRKASFTLQKVEVAVSAADVHRFLFQFDDSTLRMTSEDWKRASPNTLASGEAPMQPSSYWEQWDGPCVYNSCAGDVSRAWRAAFHASVTAAAAAAAASSTVATEADADAFVARCYGNLKSEVRLWFVEELMGVAATEAERESAERRVRRTSEERHASCVTPRYTKANAEGDYTNADGPLTSPPAFIQPSPPPPPPCDIRRVQRRAMAYASLVLAWQARDFHAAYFVVARARVFGLRVEDCAEMLDYLHEPRLLALLYFQLGEGQACARVLCKQVSLTRTLVRSSASTSAESVQVKGSSYIEAQMMHWRQCMRAKFGQVSELGLDFSSQHQLIEPRNTSRAASADVASETHQRMPVCGRGLLLQPSTACVVRAAYMLLGVGRSAQRQSFPPSNSGWDQLEDDICAFYKFSTNGATPRFSPSDSFSRLHFVSNKNSASSATFVLPQCGPVLADATATVAPLRCAGRPAAARMTGTSTQLAGSQKTSTPHLAPKTEGNGSDDADSGVNVVSAAGVRVLPSALSEFFYAVEKLDLRTVRQLVQRQPRLVHTRDVDGCTALHVVLAQLRVVVGVSAGAASTASLGDDGSGVAASFDGSVQMHERERGAEAQAALLKVLCALLGYLVHAGCPVAALSCCGWSCLDVAAAACGNNAVVFDAVTATLLAAVELRNAEKGSA